MQPNTLNCQSKSTGTTTGDKLISFRLSSAYEISFHIIIDFVVGITLSFQNMDETVHELSIEISMRNWGLTI